MAFKDFVVIWEVFMDFWIENSRKILFFRNILLIFRYLSYKAAKTYIIMDWILRCQI